MKMGSPRRPSRVRKALAMMGKFQKDPKHPFVMTMRENLAECLRMQGRGAEAECGIAARAG